MRDRFLEKLVCPGCLCLRFGPGHLIRLLLIGRHDMEGRSR